MIPAETAYQVTLKDELVGILHHRGDNVRFVLDERYRADPHRQVLGMLFEQDLNRVHRSALRLPPWFSNLLPEGRLRDWIASARDVSPAREMELLLQVGHDLPGAVRVSPLLAAPDDPWSNGEEHPYSPIASPTPWRFSLAGVAMKFSMLAAGDRLTLPASGEGGDWIVKFPDPDYTAVPRNEFAMMTMAATVGVNVPRIRLVHRDETDAVPDNVWHSEEWAYAIRRFDRAVDRKPVHIEDFAQVRNVYAGDKYLGNYESLAALIYRGHRTEDLAEFARRLAFNILIRNGDAHLKNWSLIYQDGRTPALAPAYDLVSTEPYRSSLDGPEDMALKLAGSKRFDRVSVSTFERLQRHLHATDIDLAAIVAGVAASTRAAWKASEEVLAEHPVIQAGVSASIERGYQTLLASR